MRRSGPGKRSGSQVRGVRRPRVKCYKNVIFWADGLNGCNWVSGWVKATETDGPGPDRADPGSPWKAREHWLTAY